MAPSSANTVSASPRRKPTAIVADDDFVSRMALREALLGLNIQVVAEVDNGRCALDKLGELNPDLVCLDIEMPYKNGLDVLSELRQQDERMVIVIVTASPTAQYVREALSSGADGLVTKPFNRDKISEEVRAAIARRKPKMP